VTLDLARGARASDLLAGLFEPFVAAYEVRGSGDPGWLLPEEAAQCDAVRPGRLAEFAAGRLCARRALADLGVEGVAVQRNVDRSPRWPEGVVGSITHTVGFCGAVAAARERVGGIGVDAEIAVRVTGEVWSQAFTETEMARLRQAPGTERMFLAAVVFSAKEAFYKCQFGLTGLWLDYRDVAIELPLGERRGAFLVRPATASARWSLGAFEAHGRFERDGALVVTGVALGPIAARRLARAVRGSAS